MKSNVDEQYELEMLRDLFSRLGSKYCGIFVCGESDEKDGYFPKQILVCPSEGVDFVRVYELKDTRDKRD